jgi:hypothetical protein
VEVTLDNDNWKRFVDACSEACKRKPRDCEEHKSLKRRITAHFEKDISEFKDAGVRKLGRHLVDRKAEVHRGESETRDGYIFDLDLLVVDNEGFCYTTLEAGSEKIILTDEEIKRKGEEIRNEFS